jgi:hypothetical protein
VELQPTATLMSGASFQQNLSAAVTYIACSQKRIEVNALVQLEPTVVSMTNIYGRVTETRVVGKSYQHVRHGAATTGGGGPHVRHGTGTTGAAGGVLVLLELTVVLVEVA